MHCPGISVIGIPRDPNDLTNLTNGVLGIALERQCHFPSNCIIAATAGQKISRPSTVVLTLQEPGVRQAPGRNGATVVRRPDVPGRCCQGAGDLLERSDRHSGYPAVT